MRYSGLNLLYPPFREQLLRALEEAKDAGIPLQVFETFRSRARQTELYAKGRTTAGPRVTKAKPGQSFHQYGIAADLVLWIDGKWSWQETHLYREAGPIFEKNGMQWLGRTTGDLAHYQLKNMDIENLQVMYKAMGFEGVWQYLDKVISQWGL